MTWLKEISPTALVHLNFTFSDDLHNFIIWSWIDSYSSRSNKRCFWIFVDRALANGCSSNIFLKSFSVYIGQICWVLISPCDLFRCSAVLFELCYTGVFLHASQGKVNCCCSHTLLINKTSPVILTLMIQRYVASRFIVKSSDVLPFGISGLFPRLTHTPWA